MVPTDIEELGNLTKTHGMCSYFANRIRADYAELILMPYNYILDPCIREALKLDFRNDVLIFDEAHNLPEMIEDAHSFKMNSIDMIRVMKEVNDVRKATNKANKQQGKRLSDSDFRASHAEESIEGLIEQAEIEWALSFGDEQK